MASGVSLLSSVCPSKVSAENAEEKTCSICLQSLEDKVHALACSHIFHEGCIQQWLKIKESCPLCNFVVAATPAAGAQPKEASSSEATNVSDLAPEASYSGASWSPWKDGFSFNYSGGRVRMRSVLLSRNGPLSFMELECATFPPPPP